ncbi:MAG: hypothetical protein HYU59_07630 [Magnetospirillum gryphiswaldense]|nr:hypothetical protein [Magnetospirillum gryphiswaldense]
MKVSETTKGRRAGICADSILAAIDTQRDVLAPLSPMAQATKGLLDNKLSQDVLEEMGYHFGRIEEFIAKWRPSKDPLPNVFYIQPNWASSIDSEAQTARKLLAELKEELAAGKYPQTTPSPEKRSPNRVAKGEAFIAMAIDPTNADLDDVHDAIKEACRAYGINAKRVDEDQSNERITDRIVASIRSAEFVIADLTFARPNVFFEAGFAHGLEKTPIYIAKHGTKLEFDIKDYPVIFFKSMRELKARLAERLKALLS